MRRLLMPLCLALIVVPAAAQEDVALPLATVTCDQVAASRRLSTRHLVAAELGARAARADRARFSTAAVDAADEAVSSGCALGGAGTRRLAAIVATLPPVPEAAGDLDLATLTCLSLAPSWRQVARSLVPFMVGWRDAAEDIVLTRAALDRVGEGLPRICRDEANKDRRVADILGQLR